MKAYLGVTGSVYGLIVVAHIWRIADEGRQVMDVWWVLLTLLAAAMAVWAWRLFRRLPSAQLNMWLHKTVLARIAENGGNIPADLLD